MSRNQWTFFYAALFVAGVALVVLSCLEVFAVGSYWSGLGGALAGVSAIRLVQAVRYAKDPAYAHRIEVGNSDERTAYVAGQSAALTFRMSILVLAVLSAALIPLGHPVISRVLGFVVCGELVGYWVAYLVFNRKY